ncbi:aminoglycoside 6-adenylyltransferase [Dyadobacter sp. LJ53]|uniref:aminoglycoside 6-adenylyltransferase n=1 Tax=Dyadobacter chenwenxiniae TaxID=2906456 RepID=UPI001F3555B2|nr:aminoglycoside 6-adenylyltransferase [Dyadobacter chenwenxiniae]MCF0049001.1 aminoglycoside 6-adenylyltransferase [Dyadobacter chenwenxiniae]
MTSRSTLQMMDLILGIARKDSRVLAVLQDGSRSNPNVTADIFQDFDIIYIVEDLEPYLRDHSWVDVFGERMIMQLPEDMELYPPSPELADAFSYLMLFTDGNRIDLVLVPLNRLDHFAADSLCKVLLNKNGIFTSPLPEASDTSYWTQKPSARSFTDCCNEFWFTSGSMGKALWRGEVIFAQQLSSEVVRGALLQMLDWYIGCKHEFKVNPGKWGKFYSRYLEPELYEKLLATYPLASQPQIWNATFASMDLFRYSAKFVASELGYEYPTAWDHHLTAHLQHVRDLRADVQRIYDKTEMTENIIRIVSR